MNQIFPIFDKIIPAKEKEKRYQQRSVCIWFTGLSGSGKSTLAILLEHFLFDNYYKTALFDGDNIRTGLNKDLAFSIDDRTENIRRIAEVNKLFIENGIITINAFVSPTEELRNLARSIIGQERFYLIYCKSSLATCEKRDKKGLYQKAKNGQISDFTGVSSPFEEPINADLIVDTENQSKEESLDQIIQYILPKLRTDYGSIHESFKRTGK